MITVSIPKRPISLAALVFEPGGVPSESRVPALIVVPPGGGVKEQVAGLYAKRLSKYGYLTIAYDAAHQGESGGEPRFLEDPSSRIGDISSVIDFLQEDYSSAIDINRIGVVGIGAGGGYAVAAAKMDYRIKSLVTVSMVNIGDSARRGWEGDEDAQDQVNTLTRIAQTRQNEIIESGTGFTSTTYVPPSPDNETPYDLKEASDYYLTNRCRHPRAPNKMLIRSSALILNFDAFQFADMYLTQPILMIVGEFAGSRWHSERLYDMLESNGKRKIFVVPRGTHMDLYDKSDFLAPALRELNVFIKEHL